MNLNKKMILFCKIYKKYEPNDHLVFEKNVIEKRIYHVTFNEWNMELRRNLEFRLQLYSKLIFDI